MYTVHRLRPPFIFDPTDVSAARLTSDGHAWPCMRVSGAGLKGARRVRNGAARKEALIESGGHMFMYFSRCRLAQAEFLIKWVNHRWVLRD